jgi:hypothetical protein
MPSMAYATRSTATTRIEKTAELTEDRALPLADGLLADPQARPDLGLRLPPPIKAIDELSIGFIQARQRALEVNGFRRGAGPVFDRALGQLRDVDPAEGMGPFFVRALQQPMQYAEADVHVAWDTAARVVNALGLERRRRAFGLQFIEPIAGRPAGRYPPSARLPHAMIQVREPAGPI